MLKSVLYYPFMNKSEEWGWYSQDMENRYGSSLYKYKDGNYVIVTSVTGNNVNPYPSNISDVHSKGVVVQYVKEWKEGGNYEEKLREPITLFGQRMND